MTHLNPDLRVTHYRWGSDGTETGYSFLENEDVAHEGDLDTTYFLRIVVQENNGSATSANNYQLQYNVDGAGFNNVTGASSNVRATASSNIADDAVTTNRIGGTGTFVAGRFDEADGDTTTATTLAQTEHTEILYSIQFRSADLSGGEAITFQLVSDNDSIDAHDVTPTFNVASTEDVLLADDAASGVPTASKPSLGQTHVLLADDVASGIPAASKPVIGPPHIKIQVVRNAVSTGGGTQDFTITGFGTVKGIMTFASTAESDGVAAAGTNNYASQGIGFADGTNQRLTRWRAQDGVGTSSTASRIDTVSCGGLYDGITADNWVTFNSFITDGVRFNVTDINDPFLLTVVLFGGDDLDFAVGDISADAAISSLTFQPDLFFATTIGNATNNSGISHYKRSFGIASRNQGGATQQALHATTGLSGEATTSGNARIDTDDVVMQPGASWYSDVESWESDGLTLNCTTVSETDRVAYAIVGLGAARAKIDAVAMPTTTGDVAVTGLGFDPNFAMVLGTNIGSLDTLVSTGPGISTSLGVSDGNNDYASMFGDEDGAGTTNAWTGAASKMLSVYDDVGTTLAKEATLKSFDTGGYTFNYSTADGTTDYMVRLVVECLPATADTVDDLLADDVAAGVPAVASPALGQEHALLADDVAAGAPTVGSPTLGQVHALLADDVAAGVPTVASPALAEEHALLADDVAAGVPAAGSPSLGQTHILDASNVATGPPTASSPVLGQEHALLADDVSAGVPAASSPLLQLTDILLADDVAAGVPTVASPAIGQEHALLADDVAAGVPTAASPAIGQEHALLADDVAAGVPTVASPAIGQEHALLADDVAAGVPTASSPVLTEVVGTDVLLADDVATGPPTASSPVLGQEHALLADDVSAGVPAASSPALGQEHALLADDVAAGVPAASSPALTEVAGADVLLADDVATGAPTVSSPTLVEIAEGTAAVTMNMYAGHACAIRDVQDIKATQDTMDEWGPGDQQSLPWDHPAWDNSYVHYFGACVGMTMGADADVVTKVGRASIVMSMTATGDASQTAADSGTVLILRWI